MKCYELKEQISEIKKRYSHRTDVNIENLWEAVSLIVENMVLASPRCCCEKENDEEKPDKSIVPLEPDTVTEGARIKCRR